MRYRPIMIIAAALGFTNPAEAIQEGSSGENDPLGTQRSQGIDRSDGAMLEQRGLEDIIVTARKVSESLQNVPVAITALSGSTLSSRQINNFQDLQYTVPSLTFQQSVTRDNNRIAIRGQGTSYGSLFSSVESNFADVPINSGTGASLPLYDLESIQVLKGPQGVAFGRNSSGGAILITPTSPRYKVEGYVETKFGNFDFRQIEAMINLPIIDDVLAIRASTHLERRDGTTLNLLTGTWLDNRHLDSARISILFEPADWLENRTVIAYNYTNTAGSSNHLLAVNPNGLAAQYYRAPIYSGPYNWLQEAREAIALGRNRIRSDFDGYVNARTLFLANISIFHLTDSINFKNVFGLQRTNGDGFGTDMDGTPLSVITLGRNRQEGEIPTVRTLSNEAQLQGEMFDGKLRWLAGLFISDQHQIKDGKSNSSISLEGLTFTAGSTPTITDAETHLTSFAPFAQVTLPFDFLAEGLSFTGGARHTTDKLHDRTLVRQGVAQTCTSSPTCSYIHRNGVYKGWNYALTLNYQANKKLLIYAAHRHGFKGGGLNRVGTPPELAVVKPEYVDDVEAGVKADWKIGTILMRTDLAAYQQWYKDIVRSAFVFLDGTAYNLNSNVATAKIRGVEIEQTIIPFEALRLSGGYAYTNAYFTTVSLVPYKHFPEVPRHQFNVSGSLRLGIPEDKGNLTLNVNLAYQSRHATDQNAVSPLAFYPSYALLDGRVSWTNALGSGIDFAAYVKNATDKKYILAGGDFMNTLGFLQGIYGEPRTFGVELKYRFGS